MKAYRGQRCSSIPLHWMGE